MQHRVTTERAYAFLHSFVCVCCVHVCMSRVYSLPFYAAVASRRNENSSATDLSPDPGSFRIYTPVRRRCSSRCASGRYTLELCRLSKCVYARSVMSPVYVPRIRDVETTHRLGKISRVLNFQRTRTLFLRSRESREIIEFPQDPKN